MKRMQVDKPFSSLEQDVLTILWKKPSMRVRDIYNVLKNKRKVALSSVAVILDRLHKRGIVTRTVEKARGGVRYVYATTHNKINFEREHIQGVVDQLISKFGKTATAYFHERFK